MRFTSAVGVIRICVRNASKPLAYGDVNVNIAMSVLRSLFTAVSFRIAVVSQVFMLAVVDSQT
jgi:hypothetical protein